ncbi:MAG: hypothetical protein O3A46_01655 [Candidatus Poribacteria bacterium]|nr:hypothetical protein [Candidatus Poribacteria bacterium]
MSKEFEHDDPMEMVGFVAPQLTEEDIVEMAENVIDEYIRMGWSDEEVLALFDGGDYQMLRLIRNRKGDAFVRQTVKNVRQRWGSVWRFETIVSDGGENSAQHETHDFIPLESVGRFSR